MRCGEQRSTIGESSKLVNRIKFPVNAPGNRCGRRRGRRRLESRTGSKEEQASSTLRPDFPSCLCTFPAFLWRWAPSTVFDQQYPGRVYNVQTGPARLLICIRRPGHWRHILQRDDELVALSGALWGPGSTDQMPLLVPTSLGSLSRIQNASSRRRPTSGESTHQSHTSSLVPQPSISSLLAVTASQTPYLPLI